MKRLALTTAIAVGLAIPAAASNEQLAASIGVEPGQYTLAELVALQAAIDDNDQQLIRAIQEGRVETATAADVTPGQAELAQSLGVDPSEYTLAELAQLRDARATGNAGLEAQVLEGDAGAVSGSGITDGHAQIAASLGLDPADYSFSELVRIKASRESS